MRVSYYLKKYAFQALCVLCLLIEVSCNFPFLPPTGKPLTEAGNSRISPTGLINQLFIAYEKRNIDLLKPLFAPENAPDPLSYRFYMAQSFASEKIQTGTVLRSEIIPNGAFQSISSGTYYYWGRDEEILRHERLFGGIDDLQFKAKPVVEGAIRYTILANVETLGVAPGNSGYYIKEVYDTIQAEFNLDGGSMTIFAPDLYSGPLDFDLGLQTFILNRDPNDSTLWVISRWFDFGL